MKISTPATNAVGVAALDAITRRLAAAIPSARRFPRRRFRSRRNGEAVEQFRNRQRLLASGFALP
jgi:hypothetical protein